MTEQHTTTTDARPSLRGDARRNLEKLRKAAVEVFSERGLGAPLEEVAHRAGVSTGTLYNRFGSREALIDAVVQELATTKFDAVVELALAAPDPWERFAVYVEQLCELQAQGPDMNDIIARKYPQASALSALCEETLEVAGRFIEDAQRNGALRSDFTTDDLALIFLTNASVVGATADVAPDAWRRNLGFILDGLHSGGTRV